MKFKILIFVYALLAYTGNGIAQNADNAPPVFSWISPANYSVLTTNTIRLAVSADDGENGSGVKSVIFSVNYFDNYNNEVKKHNIGEVKDYPYEFMWDCSHIPDQSIGRVKFYCEVVDNNGNTTERAIGSEADTGPMIVIDRNPRLNNEMTLQSHYTSKRLTIDGLLNDWASPDSILFFNNDNRIVVYSIWSKKELYLAIKATGRSIISHFPPGSDTIEGMTDEDVMEVYLDTDNDHFEIINLPDRHYTIAAAGMVFETISRLDTDTYASTLEIRPNVTCAAIHYGTLNDGSDEDVGYTVELAIPWKELGREPSTDMRLGFEIWNIDKDFIGGYSSYAGWSTTLTGKNNPSEWGNITLKGGGVGNAHVYGLLIVFSLALISGLALLRRKKTMTEPAVLTVSENDYITKARLYVEDHYTEETLSRDDVAPVAGLTSSYFGKVFKQETGKSFAEFLAEFRINKAKELLTTTRKNVSEIALEVGFSSQSYFGHIFKKHVNKSPSEYRNDM